MISCFILLFTYIAVFFLCGLGIKIRVRNNQSSLLLFIIASCLITVCVFRGDWMRDYAQYVEAYFSNDERMEISWKIICYLTDWAKTPLLVFFFYASISVSITIWAIVRQSKTVLLSLLIWISYIFIIQDMIQIRQGVASAIFLASIPFIREHNFKKYLIYNCIGAIFHISAIAVLPIYLLRKSNSTNKKIYLSLIPFSYILLFLNMGIVYIMQYIPIDFIQSLWITKSQMLYVTEGVNLFNMRQILLIIISTILWLRIDNIRKAYPESILYIKIFTISICVFILLFDVPDIASRLNIILAITEVIAIPSLLFLTPYRMFNKTTVIIISIVLFSTYFIRFVLP